MKQIIVTFLALAALVYPVAAQQKTPAAKKPATSRGPGAPTEASMRAAYHDGNYNKSLALADRRLAAIPGDQATLVVKALSYGMLRRKDMVLKTANILYPKSPDTAAVFLATLPANLSKEIMKSDGEWYVKEAHKLSPKTAIPYLMEASYLIDDSMFDQGKAAAIKGASLLKKNDATVLQMQFAKVLHASGAGDKAYELMDRLEKSYPKDTLVASQHYAMLLQDKNYPESLAALDHLMTLPFADTKPLHKERAFLYEDMGRHAEACAEANSLAGQDEDFLPLLRKLGCPEAFADLSPARVKSYTYDVQSQGTQYLFVVQPKSVRMNEAASFAWYMTIRNDMKGNVIVAKAALDTAHGQMNEFSGGDKSLDRLTTVWVSNAVFNDLKTRGTTTISASAEGLKTFRVVKESGDDDVTISVGGGHLKNLKTLHVRSNDDREDLWINDDPANPIITRMSIGWSIVLKRIDY